MKGNHALATLAFIFIWVFENHKLLCFDVIYVCLRKEETAWQLAWCNLSPLLPHILLKLYKWRSEQACCPIKQFLKTTNSKRRGTRKHYKLQRVGGYTLMMSLLFHISWQCSAITKATRGPLARHDQPQIFRITSVSSTLQLRHGDRGAAPIRASGGVSHDGTSEHLRHVQKKSAIKMKMHDEKNENAWWFTRPSCCF